MDTIGGPAPGTWCMKARDATKHPPMYTTVPPVKNYPVQNSSTAEVGRTALEGNIEGK